MKFGTPEGFQIEIHPVLSKQNFSKSSKDILKVARSKPTRGTPDHFPIDFGRNAFRIPKVK